MVSIEVLRTALGESYRVSRVFPNAASAECASRLLEQVNPDGFEPAESVVAPTTTVASPTTLVVDEDVIPGCRSGVCED